MKSVLVIGMGRFGRHISLKLSELGNDVMSVDKIESKLTEVTPYVNTVEIGDCTNEQVLRSIGAANFDICVVAIGSNFQASLEITSLLKELGAPRVIAKASRDVHAKFLRRNGADEVIYPEKEMAERMATRFSLNNVFGFIELVEDFNIYEIKVPDAWIGASIAAIGVRSKYKVTILAIKDGASTVPNPGPEHIFKMDEHLMILGHKKDVRSLTDKH